MTPETDPALGIASDIALMRAYANLAGVCAQADPEAWFPEKGGLTRPAKKICWSCPERRPCMKTSMTIEERFGVWAGLSERDRRARAPTWRKATPAGRAKLLDEWMDVRTEKALAALVKHYREINEKAAKAAGETIPAGDDRLAA